MLLSQSGCSPIEKHASYYFLQNLSGFCLLYGCSWFHWSSGTEILLSRLYYSLYARPLPSCPSPSLLAGSIRIYPQLPACGELDLWGVWVLLWGSNPMAEGVYMRPCLHKVLYLSVISSSCSWISNGVPTLLLWRIRLGVVGWIYYVGISVDFSALHWVVSIVLSVPSSDRIMCVPFLSGTIPSLGVALYHVSVVLSPLSVSVRSPSLRRYISSVPFSLDAFRLFVSRICSGWEHDCLQATTGYWMYTVYRTYRLV